MLKIFFIIFILLLFAIQIANFITYSLAYSPSSSRQVIVDNVDDWQSMTPFKNTTNPRLGSTDIVEVSYSSDEKTLDSTFWLNSPFDKTTFDQILDKNSKIQSVSYGAFIDTNFDMFPDYRVEIQKFETQSWKKVFGEFEPYNISPLRQGIASRFFQNEYNYTSFYNHKFPDRYINLKFDLGLINYPDRYQILFYTQQRADCDMHGICKSVYYDFTPWDPVPSPKLSVSIDPNPIDLRSGEDADVNVNVNSTSDFQPVVSVSANNQKGVLLNFPSNTRFQIPFSGIKTIPLHIHVLPNFTDYRIQHIPLVLKSFIQKEEGLISNSNNNLKSGELQFTQNANMTPQQYKIALNINVKEPLSPFDSILDVLTKFNNRVISPISGIWTFLLGLLTLGIPWIIKKYKSKKK